MTHYPGHKRAKFQDWVDAGCPERATVEISHEEQEVAAEDLLRDFLLPGCTDVMPRHLCSEIAGGVGVSDAVAGMTYGLGASILLLQRIGGDEVAGAYLDAVLGVPNA